MFLRAYEAAAGVRVPLVRLRDYVVLDLLVVWEYGRRPAQSWIQEPTFEAWATTFLSPVTRNRPPSVASITAAPNIALRNDPKRPQRRVGKRRGAT